MKDTLGQIALQREKGHSVEYPFWWFAVLPGGAIIQPGLFVNAEGGNRTHTPEGTRF